MAILTKEGRIAIAEAIQSQPIFMVWGEGSDDWKETPPDEDTHAEALNSAIGYRKAFSVQYCEPNEEGEVLIPTGRFKVSDKPTNHLLLKFVFEFEDAKEKTIREIGVLIGTKLVEGTPEGKQYFLPKEIKESGRLMLVEHRKPLYREVGVRETFEFVVSF